jgi:FKBP-type peptidyl-prolyl cis-trans isomerase 2
MPAKLNDEVKLHFTGFLETGEVFDTSEGKSPLKLKVGSKEIIPGFNKGIVGMEVGEERQIKIPPGLAYGKYFDDLIREMPKDNFDDNPENKLSEGLIVQGMVDDQQVVGSIIGINEENITVDFNHPLAGQTLTFEVKLLEILGIKS